MILVAGDSFTWGSELANRNQTFPKLLAKQYVDVSWPGYSNSSISRSVIEQCEHSDITAAIVCWSFPGRYEFRFSYDTKQKHSPWYSINSWLVQDDLHSIEKEFVTKNPAILNEHINTINRSKTTGVGDFARVFYKHVGSDKYWQTYDSLKEIVYLQNYLIVKKIPYMFTCADSNIFYTDAVDSKDSVIQSLYQQIDFDRCYFFPKGVFPASEIPRGFYQWAVENKYPVGTTHPLDAAHKAAADLMEDTFNELVQKNIQ